MKKWYSFHLAYYNTTSWNLRPIGKHSHCPETIMLWRNPKDPLGGTIIEPWARFLGREDPLEKGKATHSSILAWRVPWTIQSMGSQRVGHDWRTSTSLHSVRNQAPQQEVGSEWAKLHLPLPIAPHHLHYCLHHPPTPQSMENLCSTKPVPRAKKVGDSCHRV